jgi:uncharacterized protein (DUF2147 family)
VLLASPSAAAASGRNNELLGTWRNAHNSVHVELVQCGEAMCGVVVWANEKAKSDALKGGTDPLVGANLLRDFVRTGEGDWRGKVFVPDLRKTISGTVTLIDSGSFRARSCALGLFCRTQVWTRVN